MLRKTASASVSVMRRYLPPLVLSVSLACAHSASVMNGVQTTTGGDPVVDLDVCVARSTRGVVSQGFWANIGIGPVIKQFIGEDPNTAPFRSITEVESINKLDDCDIGVEISVLTLTSWGVWVYSAYSREELFQGKAVSRGGKIRQMVHGQFRSNPRLLATVVEQRRAAHSTAGTGSPALSAPELRQIVENAIAGAAAKRSERPIERSKVDVPGYRGTPRPQDFALVVGIEQYSEVGPAAYGERDAAAVASHLAAMGVPRRNIVHLSGIKATLTGLVKYLDAWLPRNVTAESRVYFYFSGHGAPDPESGEAYLVPFDGDPSFLETTALPLERLYASLGELDAREVVVVLDACFSGAGGRSVLAKGARPLVMQTSNPVMTSGKITLLAAASKAEITTTLESQGHGIFTYYLLEGLQGAARDRKGHVTAASLHRYLMPRVQDEARRQNRDQTPVLRTRTPDLALY